MLHLTGAALRVSRPMTVTQAPWQANQAVREPMRPNEQSLQATVTQRDLGDTEDVARADRTPALLRRTLLTAATH